MKMVTLNPKSPTDGRLESIVVYNDETTGQITTWKLTFDELWSLLERGRNIPKDANAKIENKTVQSTRYAVKYQPTKEEAENGAYFSRCCGGCNFEHEVCPVRDSVKGDHLCSYRPKVIKFTFDYVVHFVPADGTWGIFAEGQHLPPAPIAWFTTEEMANTICEVLRRG